MEGDAKPPLLEGADGPRPATERQAVMGGAPDIL